jgi:hypothetical protein
MANTFVKIASVTVGSGGAATIDFTSIPSTYTDLCLKVSARQSGASTAVKVQFNSDTSTANYQQRRVYGNGAAATSDSSTSLGWINPIGLTGSGNTASTFGNFEMYLPNYAGSNNKSISFDTVTEENGTTAFATLTAGLWLQTSAITAIKLTPNAGTLDQYSTATLFGIKNS